MLNMSGMEPAVYLHLLNHLAVASYQFREQRTANVWAMEIKYLSDNMYPNAEKIILVRDNLNTHKPASMHITFLPAETRRIIK